MKKLISLLLSVVMVIGIVGFTPALMVSAATSGIYTYTVTNGKATITDCRTVASGAIDIPSTLEGYNVTSIGDRAFFDCTSLTSITIPNCVTGIGDSTFQYCTSLTSITIPNSVTSIGDSAFSNTSLTSITIPNSVTSIGNCVFNFCTNLTSITIPNSVTSIGIYAFSVCTNLKTITIPNSVTSIGNNAFYGHCSNLTIYGTAGSCAETYAKSYNINFMAITVASTTPPTPTTINQPQTVTPLADNITVKADQSVEMNGIITYTGNIAINDYLKLDGKLEKDTINLTLKGEGQLYLETSSPNFHGTINLYKGSFDLKADGAEILKGVGADTFKIADLEFAITKLQLIQGGVRLGGSLKLPQNIGGGGVTIDTLEIVNGEIGFPSGRIDLPEFKLGKSDMGLSEAYILYDTEKNYFEGSGTLNIPKLFGVSATVGIENAKLKKVGIGISGLNVAIDASGLFLNSVYGEVEGLASPPLIITARMDITGGPQIAGVSVLKGKDLTIKVDMSGIISGSGELQLGSIPLSGANFTIEEDKGFQAGASFNAFDIITGNCNLQVYNKPTLMLQGDSTVSVNIPGVCSLNQATGYFDNEKIQVGENFMGVKAVVWAKYSGGWGIDFNADLQQMTNATLQQKFLSSSNTTLGQDVQFFETPENVFTIAQETSEVLVKITYTDGTGDVVLIAPDGTRFTPENSGMDSTVSNYIKIDNQKTIYYLLNNPKAGQWQYELVNSTFTDLQIQSGQINADPTLSFVTAQSDDIAVSVGETSVDVPLQWQCRETDGTIDILYSTEPNDQMGIPLATGLAVANGNYTWSVDNKIPSGKYYLTAVFRSSDAVPIFAYYNRSVVVTNTTTPTTPSLVTATASDGKINVSWQANTASDLKGYRIYVSDGTDERSYGVALFDDFSVEGLETNKTYRIQMTAVNNNNLESAKSTAIDTLLPAPVPPALNVAWSTNQYTNNGLMNVNGNTEAGATIQIFVNEKLAAETLTGSFTSSVLLEEGENEIKVVATKSSGDSTEKINTYWYDSSNPQLSVNTLSDGMVINSVYYVLSGKVEPNSNLVINGKMTTETNGEFESVLSLIPGENPVTITATDIAGNKTEFVGKVTVNVILGDANGDGNITAFDAVVILQIVAGMLTPSETQMISSNVNGDVSGITAFDAVLILQHIAGMSPGYLIGEPVYRN